VLEQRLLYLPLTSESHPPPHLWSRDEEVKKRREADDRIGYEGRDIHMPTGPEGMGPIAKAMYDTIVGIQTGEIESDWSVVANDAE
jgi:hypothetical protein